MELVMKYKAKDGKTFDLAQECLSYEAGLANNNYAMFDYRGNKTDDPDSAIGVYIGDEMSAKALLEKFRIAGNPCDGLDEDSTGAYCWNDMSDRYEWFDSSLMPVIVSLVNTVYKEHTND